MSLEVEFASAQTFLVIISIFKPDANLTDATDALKSILQFIGHEPK